ncbi:hypothetical protein [Hymenobacter sp. APR13]|uniref:hypothetical protein n=1 Tax=Hymenobacter sp. APR13 TaxID=1356852 RepID=UPI0012E0C330|nr:hypothetical protein [Hymenobacter sp. APR13]
MDSAKRKTQTWVILTSLFNSYVRDHGEIKARKLVTNIENDADRIRTFLKFWESKDIVPNFSDLRRVISSINWFVFSKRETMAVACLILLTKWEEEVNSKSGNKSEIEVFQIALSVLEYYKVYKIEALDIIMSLQPVEEKQDIVHGKPDRNQLLSSVAECIGEDKKLVISGIDYCGVLELDLSVPKQEIINGIYCEVHIKLRDSIRFKDKGYLTANLIDFLPSSIKDTFPIYITEEGSVYGGPWISFRVNNISSQENGDIAFILTASKNFVELDSGEIISLNEMDNEMIINCIVSELGILFSSDDHGWSFLLGGNIEDWLYDQE